MKTTKLFTTGAIALTTMALTLTSCLKDDGTDLDALVPNAVVTVKPSGDSFFLQLDDNTVLHPSNITKSPFGDKEVRAFTNYKEEGKKDDKQMIHVNWMKELLTKQTDATKGSEEADRKEFGNDPVELINAFPTVCEDGYLTLRFRTVWGRYTNIKHRVSLITGTDPKDPYTLVFRHDACGDMPNIETDGYVAFRLNSLPDTKGETVKLKVKFLSPRGEKVAEFQYKTRPSDSGK